MYNKIKNSDNMFGVDNEKIVRLAFANQNEIFDGRVYLDYDTGKLIGVSMTPNTQPHPDDHLIEVYTLHAGERGVIDYHCEDCPYRYGFSDEEERSCYPETKEECCLQAYIDNDFEDDYEDNYKEIVEERIRDIIEDLVGEELDKINEIRLELLEGQDYINAVNDYFVIETIDEIVDNVFENGFSVDDDFLGAEVIHLAEIFEYSEDEKLRNLQGLIEDKRYEEILSILKGEN